MVNNNQRKRLWQQADAVLLLFVAYVTRLWHLTALPLHNDEGLHLTRAVEVWNLHPFWDITDGKIINHWPIALFYPQNAPDFVARYATVLVVMLGVAAGYALARHLAGGLAGVCAAGLWVLSPYLFFYERLAQSDAQAAALVMVALWACVPLTTSNTLRDAVRVGVFLALAALMKFTAAPYALVVAGVVLLRGGGAWWGRVRHIVVIGAVGVVALAVPVAYLMLRGDGLFDVAIRWVVGGEGRGYMTLREKALLFLENLSGYGPLGPVWLVVFVVGLCLLLVRRRGGNALLLGLFAVPLTLIIVVSQSVFPRHLIVTLPPLVVLAGAGWGEWLHRRRWGGWMAAGLGVLLATNALPFYLLAAYAPARMPLPGVVSREFLHDHSAGFGLREAMAVIQMHPAAEAPAVASMFPASCRRANFYATHGRLLTCTDAPGRAAMLAALAEYGEVLVLTDLNPLVGMPLADMPGQVAEITAFPRPGETPDTATVVLVWLVAG